jgi:hypothetical protein
MADSFTDARKRQLVRLGGAKPPAERSPSHKPTKTSQMPRTTLRAYAADLASYKAWCDERGFVAMPATPEVVGAYPAAAGEGCARPTLRRRVAAIARACGVAWQPLVTKHPASRVHRIAVEHGRRKRIARAFDTGQPSLLPVPDERRTERSQYVDN